MTDNLREFQGDLVRAQDDAGNMLATFLRRVSFEVLTRVVEKTPVDTGRARGSWQVAIGAPHGGDRINPDPNGVNTVTEGLARLSAIGPDTAFVSIFSNLDYILALEDGSSQQSPQGMVAVTLAELQAGGVSTVGIDFRLGRSD